MAIKIKGHVEAPVRATTCPDASSVNSSSSPSPSETSRPSAPTDLSSSSIKTTTGAKVRKTAFQAKPKVLFVGDPIAQKLNFRKMEVVTKTTIKTAKGYGSGWEERAKKKNENMTDVTKHELEKDSFERLVLAAPTEDITNLNYDNDTKVLKEDIRHSCLNIMNIAENALADHKTLKNVTILDHTPRFDSTRSDPRGIKNNLVMFANSYMRELLIDSPHSKSIHVGSHSLDTDRRNNWHTDEHTGSVTNILLTSFQSMSNRQYMSEENHTTCPQAMYMKRKMRMYSEVVAGSKPVKTSNRFSPLTQISGNW